MNHIVETLNSFVKVSVIFWLVRYILVYQKSEVYSTFLLCFQVPMRWCCNFTKCGLTVWWDYELYVFPN